MKCPEQVHPWSGLGIPQDQCRRQGEGRREWRGTANRVGFLGRGRNVLELMVMVANSVTIPTTSQLYMLMSKLCDV